MNERSELKPQPERPSLMAPVPKPDSAQTPLVKGDGYSIAAASVLARSPRSLDARGGWRLSMGS